MNAPIKLGVFTLGLIVLFAAAFGAGRLTGPTGPAAAAGPNAHGGWHTQPAPSAQAAVPAGLQIAQDGYRLEVLTPHPSGVFQFRILGPDAKPLTAYTTAHDKDLHLIVARRDLTGFQHVHPTLDAAGIWSVPLRVDQPGAYRVFADFQPVGRDKGLILGADLTAPGDYQPQPLAPVTRSTTIGAYTVTLEGDLVAGTSSKLTLTVTRAGAPVTDLEPYLGAFGHLVALRDGDLAYLHVHPEASKTAGPQIVFFAEVPSDGNYGLYLDFQHASTVHTAQFTATAGHVAAHATPAPAASHGH